MADQSFFKEIFESLAQEGFIGNPRGDLAYCYMRVSSSDQAEEGRSGLPRQIQHIHDIALLKGYKVPWELVFADDHTGFEFKDRPELSRLRKEYKSHNRRANVVIMEYLDRLSRNADWHQGFLLDEMKEYGLSVVFWKSFSSRIERALMGAISQEGMEQAKQRMAEGNIFKAKDGRVTARTPAYGYRLVDSQGREGESAKKDTHYAPDPDEADIVRYIFDRVAYDGVSMRSLAKELEGVYPPPKKMSNWEPKLLTLMIRNPVYKGEFYAHKFQEIRVPSSRSEPDRDRLVVHRIQRPKDEWILVQVPAIVSGDVWEMANRILDMNSQMSRRNAKQPYLLTGLIKCASCGYSYIGGTKTIRKNGKEYHLFYYRCSSRSNRTPAVIERIGCDQSQIACHYLDDAVWSVAYQVLLDPNVLLNALERIYSNEANEQLLAQIRFLSDQIKEKDVEDEKLYRAYQADVFDQYEFAARRKQLRESKVKLEGELEKLSNQVMTREKLDGRKRFILSIAERAKKTGVAEDAPFEIRQRVIKTVVDKITLNVREGWFAIEGVLNGTWSLPTDDTNSPLDNNESNHIGKDS